MSLKRFLPRRVVLLAVSVTVLPLAIGSAAGALVHGHNDTAPEVGRIVPVDQFDAQGNVLPNRLPHLIPIAGRDGGSPGYIEREELYPEAFGRKPRSDGRQTVVDLNRHIVGYMYPGVGYVPLDQAGQPGYKPASPTVTTVQD